MRYNGNVPHRQSIRLRGFDYTKPGSYFITVCTHERAPLFGDVVDGAMVLNAAGEIACAEWQNIAAMRHGVSADEFVIMPNHMHGIITVGAHCMRPVDSMRPVDNMHSGEGRVQRAPTVGDIVRGYKSAVTRRIWNWCGNRGQPVWQRNYYEHIIRHEQAHAAIADYIRHNPQRWQQDVYCTEQGQTSRA